MARKIDAYLSQLLELFWLRPETALWRTFDCLLMDPIDTSGSCADLGCGDGLLSFVMAGGRVRDYDVSMAVGGMKRYNKGADVFNVKASRKLPVDCAKLRHRFDYGIDHKAGLISKAAGLDGFYKKTLVHDLNKPLPLPAGSLDWAFSNVLYWLDDLDSVLRDWRGALKASGRLIVFVPNETFHSKAWLYYEAPHRGDLRYLNYFDRGYGRLIRHAYSYPKWRTLFQKNGFNVVRHSSYLSNPVMQIWNIGTRPMFPVLMDLSSRLKPSDRKAAKRNAVNYFSAFLAPIVKGEFGRKLASSDAAFHFFVLEKRS